MRGGVIDQSKDDAAIFGLDLDLEPQPEYFEVEPDAWPAVRAFLRCQTQWRSGANGLMGLDYTALAWTFTLDGVMDAATVLSDIQVIEAEVLAIAHEKGG